MPLYHTEDQAMLADSVTGFMADEGGIKKQLRHWRDMNCKDGFGHGLWKQFAEMGLTGRACSPPKRTAGWRWAMWKPGSCWRRLAAT
jgi:alkylation response protein AidB-like acyl-CoA dehydrogenase